MKKFLFIIIMFLSFTTIPNVVAKENVYIEEISLDSKSETCIKSNVNFNGLNVSFDVKFQTLGDFAKYKIIINNSSSEDYELNLNNNSISDYISYEYDSADNIIKANKKKTIYLTLRYSKSIPEELVENESFVETNNFVINLSNNSDDILDIINNPETSFNCLLFVIVIILLVVSIILCKYTNNKKYLNLFIMSLIIIPVGTYALKKIEIKIDSKVEIELKPTTLIPGPNFNVLLKTLSGNINPTYNTVDENIIEFKRSFELPENGIATSKISTNESLYDVVVWFDNGTIYWYSEATRIYLNEDSYKMFYNLKNIVNIELKYFDTLKVENMSHMFYDDKSLEKIDVSLFNTSKVSNFGFMFYGCNIIEEIDISSFSGESLTDSNSIYGMFSYCYKLKKLDLSSLANNKFKSYPWFVMGDDYEVEEVNLTGWDFSNNVYGMDTFLGRMLGGSGYSLAGGDGSNSYVKLKKIDLTNVKFPINMRHAFDSIPYVETLVLDNVDTSDVINMNCCFINARGLKSLDLSSFDTSKVTNMSYMFCDCTMLENIYVSNKWNTDNVMESIDMFKNASKLPNYDSNVVDKTKAFAGDGGYLKLK